MKSWRGAGIISHSPLITNHYVLIFAKESVISAAHCETIEQCNNEPKAEPFNNRAIKKLTIHH